MRGQDSRRRKKKKKEAKAGAGGPLDFQVAIPVTAASRGSPPHKLFPVCSSSLAGFSDFSVAGSWLFQFLGRPLYSPTCTGTINPSVNIGRRYYPIVAVR